MGAHPARWGPEAKCRVAADRAGHGMGRVGPLVRGPRADGEVCDSHAPLCPRPSPLGQQAASSRNGPHQGPPQAEPPQGASQASTATQRLSGSQAAQHRVSPATRPARPTAGKGVPGKAGALQVRPQAQRGGRVPLGALCQLRAATAAGPSVHTAQAPGGFSTSQGDAWAGAGPPGARPAPPRPRHPHLEGDSEPQML